MACVCQQRSHRTSYMLYPFGSPRSQNRSSVKVVVPKTGTLKQALVVIALLGAFAPVASASASCRVPAGRTVATGRVAKLISVPTPDGSALFACIRRDGRKIALDDSFADARVAGRWVAWQRAGANGRWRIAVHDLRTGKERLVIGHVADGSLCLTTRGSIAWAQEQESSEATPLYANEIGSGGRLLDGGDVDSTSVDIGGRRVSWMSGGVERSALLR